MMLVSEMLVEFLRFFESLGEAEGTLKVCGRVVGRCIRLVEELQALGFSSDCWMLPILHVCVDSLFETEQGTACAFVQVSAL